MNQVRYIPIDSIIVTNEYLRLNTKIEELKKSIQAVGLIHPLSINSSNELIAGGRRYSALKELGFEEVPVVVVERDPLEQELISIDENLMRLPLTNVQMERALNRGREIYETLHPSAKRVPTDPSTLEKKKPRTLEVDATAAIEGTSPEEDVVPGKSSYVEVTAKKTGLSEGAIRSAIIRDECASDMVKQARYHGELGAGQANEIVKLDKELQDKVLPMIGGMATKEVRQVIKDVQSNGLDDTIQELQNREPLPRDYDQLYSFLKRLNRVSGRIVRKKELGSGTYMPDVLEELERGVELLKGLLALNATVEEVVKEEIPATTPVEVAPPEPQEQLML